MSILSEEKKECLRNGACDDYFEARPQIDSNDRRRVFEAGFDGACKAIEAAVLEAQGKQEPAYTFHLDSTGAAYLRGVCVSTEGDPLYAAPIIANANVQPNMVLVPREPTEKMLKAGDLAATYAVDEWDMHDCNVMPEQVAACWGAMIAAAEGKK